MLGTREGRPYVIALLVMGRTSLVIVGGFLIGV
jgi:hypothetical protein